MRHLMFVGAALLLLGLAACADVVARPSPAPTPSPTGTPTPAASASRSAVPAKPTPTVASAAGAAAALHAQVTGIPVLLPSTVPPGMQAIVAARPDSYDVQYTDDTHAHTIWIYSDGPLGVNGPHQAWRQLPFRGVTADYFVDDTTTPTSKRRLYWREQAARGEFLLAAAGFTEDEFWQIANSVRPA